MIPLPRLGQRSFRPAKGFTLVELLIVMTIIALLAALSIGVFTYANRSAARNKTSALLQQIVNGLERYKQEYAEYPEAVTPLWNTPSYTNYSPAQMLYQALSRDGCNQISNAPPTTIANPTPTLGTAITTTATTAGSSATSDGSVDNHEAQMTKIMDVDPTMYRYDSVNGYYLGDAFNHPFMYMRANITGQVASTPTPGNPAGISYTYSTKNSTYDLWSWADDTIYSTAMSGTTWSTSYTGITTQGTSAQTDNTKWIKNW